MCAVLGVVTELLSFGDCRAYDLVAPASWLAIHMGYLFVRLIVVAVPFSILTVQYCSRPFNVHSCPYNIFTVSTLSVLCGIDIFCLANLYSSASVPHLVGVRIWLSAVNSVQQFPLL